MSNKIAVSLLYNLIEDLVNKSSKLTDQSRYNAMMKLVADLEKVKEQFNILGYEEIWIEIEKQMRECDEKYGEVLIRLPLGFNRSGSVKYIDFTETFKK